MNEIIKDIPGFEGIYKASTSGYIISYARKTPKILKGVEDKDGYYHVTLYKDKKPTQGYVHRFIALTFLPEKEGLPIINHVDEDKKNNSAENLERCTTQYNIEYSTAKNYEFINPEGEHIKVYNLSKFCKENHLHKGCMSLISQDKRPTHRGWTKA